MIRFIALAILLVASPASAGGVADLIGKYYSERPICRGIEAASAERANKACAELDKIGARLKESGYCWIAGEQEWQPCPLTQ